jgi:Ca2+-binding EF-hand superfamily protein
VDLEFAVRLGKGTGKQMPVELMLPGGKKPALADGVANAAGGVVSLALDDTQISLGAGPADDQGRVLVALFSPLLQQFRARVNPDKGFLEMKDVEGPQFQQLRNLFPLLDRDGDGKLTEKEVQSFTALERDAPASHLWLTVQDHGRGLFQLLDVNRDGRLSVPELRNAWKQMAPLDRNKDGVISPEEITRQFQLNVSVGSPNSRFVVSRPVGTPNSVVPVTARGPQWFRKMDNNSDGYVSAREFLGPRADFDRIDADADGFLAAEEAEAFEATLKKQAKK